MSKQGIYPIIWISDSSKEDAKKLAKSLNIDAVLLDSEDDPIHAAVIAQDLAKDDVVIVVSSEMTRVDRRTVSKLFLPIWLANSKDADVINTTNNKSPKHIKKQIAEMLRTNILFGAQYVMHKDTGIFDRV